MDFESEFSWYELYDQNGNRQYHVIDICMKSVRASLVIFLLSVTNVRPVSLSQVMKNVRKKKKKKTLWKSHIYMKALGVSPENDVLLFVGVFYTFFGDSNEPPITFQQLWCYQRDYEEDWPPLSFSLSSPPISSYPSIAADGEDPTSAGGIYLDMVIVVLPIWLLYLSLLHILLLLSVLACVTFPAWNSHVFFEALPLPLYLTPSQDLF